METGYINCTKNKWGNILKEVLTSDFFYNESYDKIVYLFSLIECMIQNAKKYTNSFIPIHFKLNLLSVWSWYMYKKKIAYF